MLKEWLQSEFLPITYVLGERKQLPLHNVHSIYFSCYDSAFLQFPTCLICCILFISRQSPIFPICCSTFFSWIDMNENVQEILKNYLDIMVKGSGCRYEWLPLSGTQFDFILRTI